MRCSLGRDVLGKRLFSFRYVGRHPGGNLNGLYSHEEAAD